MRTVAIAFIATAYVPLRAIASMQTTTKAIVLSSLKYGDTSLIVKAFTLSDGFKSYLLKGVLSSKKGKLKPGLFQPLTLLEMVVQHKNKGGLERILEARVDQHTNALHTHILKNSQALFLAETLSSAIQEEEENAGLYYFLEYAIFWMDQHKVSANFHLLFLIQLTKYLGCSPDTTAQHLPYFDLYEGSFVPSPGVNPLMDGKVLENFKQFLGINFDALFSIKINNIERQDLLKKLLLYFELHLHGFRTPKSLAVLNTVFH